MAETEIIEHSQHRSRSASLGQDWQTQAEIDKPKPSTTTTPWTQTQAAKPRKPNQQNPSPNRKLAESGSQREESGEWRAQRGKEKEEREKIEKMRRKEKIKLKYAGTYAGIGNSFLIFWRGTVTFHLWKAIIAKWECEEEFKGLLEVYFSILLSTCGDEEWINSTARVALSWHFLIGRCVLHQLFVEFNL